MTYNVGVFTKYISDGSYQMIADMMTEGKADLVGISELDSCTVAPAGSSSSRSSPS